MPGRLLIIREDEIVELLTDKKLQKDTESYLRDINYFGVISRRKATFVSQNVLKKLYAENSITLQIF